MKLKANVRRVAQATIHRIGSVVDGEVVGRKALPEASWVEIVSQPAIASSTSFMLFRYSENGRFGGDTWHMTLAEAKEQANYEYGIEAADWVQVPD